MRDNLVDHAVCHGMKSGNLAAGTADTQAGNFDAVGINR